MHFPSARFIIIGLRALAHARACSRASTFHRDAPPSSFSGLKDGDHFRVRSLEISRAIFHSRGDARRRVASRRVAGRSLDSSSPRNFSRSNFSANLIPSAFTEETVVTERTWNVRCGPGRRRPGISRVATPTATCFHIGKIK